MLGRFAWVAGRAARRAGQLARDSVRIAGGLYRTIGWAISPSPPTAGLAVLEGESVARVGTPALYHVRLCNPTDSAEALRVAITGWRQMPNAAVTRDFELHWDVTLPPGASADRWVRSTWSGDGVLLDAAPDDAPTVWSVGDPPGRWIIEASLAAGGGGDQLRIAGGLVP